MKINKDKVRFYMGIIITLILTSIFNNIFVIYNISFIHKTLLIFSIMFFNTIFNFLIVDFKKLYIKKN